MHNASSNSPSVCQQGGQMPFWGKGFDDWQTLCSHFSLVAIKDKGEKHTFHKSRVPESEQESLLRHVSIHHLTSWNAKPAHQ